MKAIDMKKYLFTLIILMLVFIFACKEESNPVKVGTDPAIEQIMMREKWNSGKGISKGRLRP